MRSCKPSLITTTTKALSTRTDFSHRTEDNIIKGNWSLDYPVEDCFTFFSKRMETFGDALAMVWCIFFFFPNSASRVCEQGKNLGLQGLHFKFLYLLKSAGIAFSFQIHS